MTITLTGLTPRQRLIADLLWHTDDPQEVARLCSLDSDARIVYDLIVAAELDSVTEVSADVKDLISRCSR
jgi:hypothetical protein